MAMMYCWGCGKQIHETAPTCPNCGALQGGTGQSGSVSAPPSSPLSVANKSLQTHYAECFTRKYGDFGGRARRREYWGFVLFNVLAGIGCTVLDFAADTRSDGSVYGLFYTLYFLLAFIPGLSVLARRLHDIGKSGWTVCWIFLPLIGFLYILVLLCRDGEPRTNRFGTSPKYPTGATAT